MQEHANAMTECPDCGEVAVSFDLVEQNFEYGDGDTQATLAATIPVGHCSACGFGFTDAKAAEAKHEAVCAHLKVFSPRAIAALRKRLGLTRSALAEITRIGEASIARWERGAGIQNGAMDQLLYLLNQPGTLCKLRARNYRVAAEADPNKPATALIYKFPSIGNDLEKKEEEAKAFFLHRSVG